MTLRIGLIGRGPWGRNIQRTLVSFPGVSVEPIGRGETASRDLDGVVIASVSATHAELALPYIEAGIPTFIEKPMATGVADARRICAAAERAAATVFVGHIHLHNPAFLALLDVQPRLGAIRSVACHGMNDRPRADTSVLWDWLPHDLSMALALFRRPPDRVSVTALGDAPATQAAVATFAFGNVPMVSTVSWRSPVRRQTMTVEAENGTLVFDDKAERKVTLRQGDTVSYPTYADELPLTRELRLFIEAIRSGSGDHAQALQGAIIVAAIVAAEDSLAQGGATVEIAGA
ncbi:MAG: Gfo/Idh/MocA family oxidoreductase [Xanthobacteraceae bacterium]|nr:Gfo/Idh/MocA family oxidoreductase [Xanthobacteraceae bacterium]